MIKLSIIIPTFNSAATIEQCLNSIINQKVKYIEVICIDAVSSDDTIEILKKYANLYSYIKWISEPDKGIYDAMNKGINLAKGKWIYFLGSDDLLFNDHVLSDIDNSLENPRLDIIYGNVNSPVYGEKYDGEFDRSKIAIKNIAHQAIFYRKKVFKKIGFYDLNYKMLADWDLNLRWVIKKRIQRKYVDLTIARYAPGGKSETITDTTFYADFQNLLYKYGYKKRTLRTQIRYFIEQLKKNLFNAFR